MANEHQVDFLTKLSKGRAAMKRRPVVGFLKTQGSIQISRWYLSEVFASCLHITFAKKGWI